MDTTELTPIVTFETAGLTVVEFCDWFLSDDLGYYVEDTE